MICMKIRIVYGKLRYNFCKLFSFTKLSRTIYGIKTLDLKFDSFIHVYFKSKNLYVVRLSKDLIYSQTILKEIAVAKYVYSNIIFLYNEDYSENSVNCKKLINEYYLKLLNGGSNNDN